MAADEDKEPWVPRVVILAVERLLTRARLRTAWESQSAAEQVALMTEIAEEIRAEYQRHNEAQIAAYIEQVKRIEREKN